jgi:hypothetical protein
MLEAIRINGETIPQPGSELLDLNRAIFGIIS